MDFYIDVKYREVIKRTFPWFRKEKVYALDAVHIYNDKMPYPKRRIVVAKRYTTSVAMAKAIESVLLECDDEENRSIRFFSIDTTVKACLFYKLFDELPYWMPKGIIDIQLWADTFIIPKVDLLILAERDKIDFVQTRPLSLQEMKDVIRQHVDYPITARGAHGMYELHKFYTDLESDFIK